jgi:hypothetical protein
MVYNFNVFTVFDVLAVIVLTAVAGAVLMIVRDRFTQSELSVLWLSFGAHVAAMFAQQAISLGHYEGGDMYSYALGGAQIADAITREPTSFLPLTLRLLFQQETAFPFFILGEGSSTGSMVALTGLCDLFTGSSLWGTALVFTFWAFFGKVLLYTAFRQWFHPSLRSRLQVGVFLVPSVIFWSSAIMKESVAIGAIGIVTFGIVRMLRRRVPSGLALAVFGAFVIGLIKPYILFPLTIATGIWFVTHRAWSRSVRIVVRPLYVVLGLAVAVGGAVAVNELFPKYSFDNFNDESTRLQEVGLRIGGGSTYTLSGTEHRTAVDQVLLSPLALFTALFRPLPPEVRNPFMGLNSIETLIIFIFALRAVWQRSWRWAWGVVRDTPPLMFCIVFVVLLGIGVGLTCTNMGTLSRYRMPLVPFLTMMLLMLTVKDPKLVSAAALAPSPASPLPRGPAVPDAVTAQGLR